MNKSFILCRNKITINISAGTLLTDDDTYNVIMSNYRWSCNIIIYVLYNMYKHYIYIHI